MKRWVGPILQSGIHLEDGRLMMRPLSMCALSGAASFQALLLLLFLMSTRTRWGLPTHLGCLNNWRTATSNCSMTCCCCCTDTSIMLHTGTVLYVDKVVFVLASREQATIRCQRERITSPEERSWCCCFLLLAHASATSYRHQQQSRRRRTNKALLHPPTMIVGSL